MIGDDHLHLRAQLGAAIFSLTTLAQDIDAEPQVLKELHGLGDGLLQPLLLISLGQGGAGKSSLLNALFGREFCIAEGEAAKIRLLTFGTAAGNVERDGIVECRRPLGFLRDFQVIDTPGASTMTPEDWSALEKFLPAASAVLVVLSVTNPWVSSTWNAMHSLAKKCPKKIVFVVQQADQRSDVEVAAVIKHVEQTVREKLGIGRPVVAVSAKNALLAKTTGTDKAGLLAGSRIESLETLINEVIATDDTSLGQLRTICETAEKALGAIGRKVRESVHALKKENERLGALQQKIEDRKEQSLRQVGGALWTLAQTCETAQKRSEETLRKHLTFFSTLKLAFHRADFEAVIHEEVNTRLREAIEKQIEGSVDLLQADLKSVWQELQDSLGKSLGQETMEAPNFVRQRANLIKCIEAGLDPSLSSQKLEMELPRLLRQMAGFFRGCFGVALAAGIATVPAMQMHLSIAPIIGGTAAAAAIIGLIMTAAGHNRLLALFREIMVKKREAMLAPIEDHMRHTIDTFYKEIPATLEMLHGFCVTQQKIYEPLLARTQQLDQMFRSIASTLGEGQEKMTNA